MSRTISLKYKKRRLKYGNRRTEFRAKEYDSALEARVARDLRFRQLAGELIDVKRQVTIPLNAHGQHICNYRIDFVVIRKDGITEYVEAKGYPTPYWRLKWKLFAAQLALQEPLSKMRIITK